MWEKIVEESLMKWRSPHCRSVKSVEKRVAKTVNTTSNSINWQKF